MMGISCSPIYGVWGYPSWECIPIYCGTPVCRNQSLHIGDLFGSTSGHSVGMSSSGHTCVFVCAIGHRDPRQSEVPALDSHGSIYVWTLPGGLTHIGIVEIGKVFWDVDATLQFSCCVQDVFTRF